MKTLVAALSLLALTAIWMPAYANECTGQLAELTKELAAQKNLSEEKHDQVEALMAEASEANKDGDEETCLAAVEDARAIVEGE